MKSAKVWISIKLDSKFALHVNKCDVGGVLKGVFRKREWWSWSLSFLFFYLFVFWKKDFAENNAVVFTLTNRYVLAPFSSFLLRNTRPFLLTALSALLQHILDVSFPQYKARRLEESFKYQERTFVKSKLLMYYVQCFVCFTTQTNKHCLLQPHDEAPLAALCVSQLSEGLCEQELVAAVSCMQIAEICQSHVREIFFDLLRNWYSPA